MVTASHWILSQIRVLRARPMTRISYSLFFVLASYVTNSLAQTQTRLQFDQLPPCQALQRMGVIEGLFAIGAAFSKGEQDQTPVYCEYHLYPSVGFISAEQEYTVSRSESLVVYVDSTQKFIAIKRLNFFDESGRDMLPKSAVEQSAIPAPGRKNLADSQYNTAPDFKLFDFRSGKKMSSKQVNADQQDALAIEVRYQASADSTQKIRRLKELEHAVVDAGFLNAIRNNWKNLAIGKTAKILFVSPQHQRTITLAVKQRSKKRCQSLFNESLFSMEDQLVCLEAQAASSFLRLFSSKIRLLYHPGSERLYVFCGVSNLDDDKGDSQQVEIAYTFDA